MNWRTMLKAFVMWTTGLLIFKFEGVEDVR